VAFGGGLKLRAGQQRGLAVLRALLESGVRVSSFAPAVPPLEEIFVHVVEAGIGLDRGRSGPPTADPQPLTGGAR